MLSLQTLTLSSTHEIKSLSRVLDTRPVQANPADTKCILAALEQDRNLQLYVQKSFLKGPKDPLSVQYYLTFITMTQAVFTAPGMVLQKSNKYLSLQEFGVKCCRSGEVCEAFEVLCGFPNSP